MKTLTLIVLLTLASAAVALAQGILPVTTARTITDTASVTWDSNYVGSSRTPKVLEVLNEGTPNLYVAIGNDTAVGSFYIVKQNEKLRIDRLVERSFIRAKSASSTAIYRINIQR